MAFGELALYFPNFSYFSVNSEEFSVQLCGVPRLKRCYEQILQSLASTFRVVFDVFIISLLDVLVAGFGSS